MMHTSYIGIEVLFPLEPIENQGNYDDNKELVEDIGNNSNKGDNGLI